MGKTTNICYQFETCILKSNEYFELVNSYQMNVLANNNSVLYNLSKVTIILSKPRKVHKGTVNQPALEVISHQFMAMLNEACKSNILIRVFSLQWGSE